MKIIRKNLTEDGRVYLTGYIQEPSKELKAVANKPAVLVLPGGAYLLLQIGKQNP